MSIYKIKGYAYFGTETRQMDLCFYNSDALYAKVNNGITYNVTGDAANVENPAALVNNYLGEKLITDMMPYNIALTSGQSVGGDWFSHLMTRIGMSYNAFYPANNNTTVTKFVTLGNETITSGWLNAGHMSDGNSIFPVGGLFGHNEIRSDNYNTHQHIDFYIPVLPSDFIKDKTVNPELPDDIKYIHVIFRFTINVDTITCTAIVIETGSFGATGSAIKTMLANYHETANSHEDTDTDNPFPPNDDDPPGGDGPSNLPINEPTDVPDLPSISAVDLGLISLYTPTAAQIKSLSNFLWSGAFDPDTFKKLFSDPMDAIIGLGIVPIVPSSAGSKNVKFGNIDSGISMPYVSTQWAAKDCGSVNISNKVKSFLDYDPYTKISIYLPFLGFRDLSADDVMGGSIKVVYNMDILTGSCSVFVKHSTRGVLYNYNGNCIMNIPLSAANYSSAIQNAVSTVASGVGVLAGMATGAAPVTAMSAVSMLASAANTAMSSKPNIQRSGNLGGAAGLLSVKKPFVVIQRPNVSVPSYIQNYVGYMSNRTASLGSCSGFTMVEQCHIDGISATPGEITEIETLLKQGVIL